MFDLRKFLEDVGRTIGSFTGANNQPATSRQQQAPQAQPATTRKPQQRQQQNLGQALQQQRQQYKLPQVDFGKFANDTFSAISNVAKPISEGGANPFADAGKFAEEKIPVLLDAGVKAANTATLPVQAGIAKATGTNNNPEVQQHLYKTLQNSFISPESAGGRANPLQFAKEFTGAGVDTAGLLPITGGAKAIALGTKPSLDMLKQSALTSAKQASILGTASTANDVIQGRGVTAQSLGANYLAPAALGVGSDVVGSLVKPAARVAATAPSRVTNYGLARPTNLTTPEINAALRVRQAREGYISPQEISPNEIALYDAAQTKLGARPGTPEGDMAVVNALASERNFNTQRDVRRQATADTLQRGSEFVRSRLIPGGTLDAPLGDGVPRSLIKSDASSPAKPATTQLATSRYASQTIPESRFVGDEVSTQTKANAPQYLPETEQGRYTETLRKANQEGFNEFENNVQTRLQNKLIDSQTVSDAQAVAQRLEAKGDDSSLRRAADIYDQLSGQLTRAGQTVQAAAIMSRRTPDGIKYQALKDLRKNGIEVTPDIQRNLNSLSKQIAATEPGSEARKIAIAKLAKEVEQNIPNGAVSNLVSVWKAGLLSGVKTTQGNIVSNATFAGLKKASDPLTIMADNIMSLVTDRRTATGTMRGSVEGTKEGLQKGLYTLKTGIDTRDITDKYETRRGINFNNKALQKFVGLPAQKVFDFLGSQDQPFYFSQLRNSLYDQAKAEGINKGLSGRKLSEYMDDAVDNPSQKMLQTATDDAAKAVLGYDTFGYKAIRGIHLGIDNFKGGSDQGKQVAHAVVDVLAPFVRVPTAFLSRTLDFTPIGIGKETISQVFKREFNQRSLSKAIGEGLTGTGAIALGVMLSQNNQLSGDYPDDPKEQQRWRAEGIQPNSIKIGDRWVSLNYMGPLGLLFGAGKKFEEAVARGEDAVGSASQAAAGFGQTLLGQSFLQGFSGFSDAIQDPERELKSFLNSQVASTVPNIVNDIANLTDNLKRQVNSPFEAIQNKIPGARQQLDPKLDVYGNQITQNPLETLTALKPSGQEGNDVTNEVSRLAQINPDDTELQVTPVPVQKTLKIDDQEVKLSDRQRYDLQKQVGQSIQSAWGTLIATKEYGELTDLEKAKALSRLGSDVASVAKRQYVESNSLATYEKDMSSAEKRIANGDIGITRYTASEKGDTPKTYAERYENALEEYKNDSPAWSRVEKIKKEKELAKLTVQKDYDNDTVDAYGLSKTDAWNLLSTDQDGKKLFDQIVQYGDALVNAGIEKQNKYRDKYGNIVLKDENAETAKKGKGKGKGKKGKFDYASQFATTDKLGNASTDAIRKLVRGTKITRKKIGGKA